MDTLILDNPLTAWLTAIALAGVTWATLDFARRKGMARIEKLAGTTSTALDDALVGALAATKWWFYMWLSVFVGAYALDLETRHAEMLEGIATIAVLIQAAVWLLAALAAWLRVYAEHQAEDGHTFRLGGTILFVAKLVTWTVFSLLLLENLGVDVSALVAGFGVGGIAVALAVQNILGDLFASLSIALDQPFVQGDFIIVGEHSGTVVQTGLKTTRLKSISGEQLVFSNTDLLDARIRNYGRMDERRVVFQLGVEYDTSRENLDAIPGLIKAAIEAQDNSRFDRCHFKSYGDSALMFETVYYMKQPDYALYMDTQHIVNLQILDDFRGRGIGFAFPTRTVHMINQS